MNGLAGLKIANLDEVASPSLLVWPERVQANIERMIAMVDGAVNRLRPHVKTHKMAAVVRMQMETGVSRFKCATIAEAEMCLQCGARDILLAYPVVGPNCARLVRLASMYPDAQVSLIADDGEALATLLREQSRQPDVSIGVYVDIDCGMGRTGTDSVENVVKLAQLASDSGGLGFSGLHVYDGHVRATPVEERESVWSAAMAEVERFENALEEAGFPVEAVIGGGSPTFGFHAAKRGWQCSPGTTLFWDGGYGGLFPDLPFEVAAVVLTRVISRPGTNRLCLDLGHKAIASEGPLDKRVHLPGLDGGKPVMHSEEHLVVEIEDRDRFEVGDAFLGIPHHICPTVALHQEAVLVRDGRATGDAWPVTARNRRITV